ncbi:MAG: hypothetical protein KatS3mg003_2228 [Candidatus Nitrosocaldaceae archaeon]|nr:MAG: hypothetical protein KatS3mg003_2170 [Candidatus Nitrosocaldaceae archaeon]GIU72749.1 MAG: hypothetical protein KatS3mg003_2228 [Candidatus Nitrosocaldaceae archaeon]
MKLDNELNALNDHANLSTNPMLNDNIKARNQTSHSSQLHNKMEDMLEEQDITKVSEEEFIEIAKTLEDVNYPCLDCRALFKTKEISDKHANCLMHKVIRVR